MRITNPLVVEISPGELFDKITVLQIKLQKICNPAKLANIRFELQLLQKARDESLESAPEVHDLVERLYRVNLELYGVIDGIYACEAANEGWEKYVSLARNVYYLNDARAVLKRSINGLFSSRLLEEKGHL